MGYSSGRKRAKASKTIWRDSVLLGADPELFFAKVSKDGRRRIVGSELYLPSGEECNITVDGVQLELNPAPSSCRVYLAMNIKNLFLQLRDYILPQQENLQLDFRQAVTISKQELNKLSEQAKVLGCEPSFNSHKETVGDIQLKVDAEKYRVRSSAGHLHFGQRYHKINPPLRVLDRVRSVVHALDLFLGNTCVMLDTSPASKKRRKLYGLAGEYRLPPWGLEYRTLSNFWLRAYPLMSFVTGMGRVILRVASPGNTTSSDLDKLLKVVPTKDLIYAINHNDPDIARENFEKAIVPLTEAVRKVDSYVDWPLKNRLPKFRIFVEKGLDHWFKEDPLDHWCNLWERPIVTNGWERFVDNIDAKE
jgi:hypothetical protein